jgi:hypothetical protein
LNVPEIANKRGSDAEIAGAAIKKSRDCLIACLVLLLKRTYDCRLLL